MDYAALKEKIREAGKKLGFAAVGVARAEPGPAVEKMREWLAAGCQFFDIVDELSLIDAGARHTVAQYRAMESR